MTAFTDISIGTVANDGTGTKLRDGGDDINNNFNLAANTSEENTFDEKQTISKDLLNLGDGTNPMRHILANRGGAVDVSVDLIEVAAGVDPEFGTFNNFGFRLILDGATNTFKLQSCNSTTVNDRVLLARDTGYIDVPGVYSETTASAANVFVDTDGSIRRSTSSEKIKEEIKDYSDDSILKIKPVTFKEKGTDKKFIGFIAEQVGSIDKRFATNLDKNLPGLDTNAILAAAVSKIQDLEKRLSVLEG
jgi:hypothetical protein